MLGAKEKILLRGSNLWYLGEGMLGPLFAIFAERIGGNVLDIAWAWALYLTVTGVLTIAIGKISDVKLHKEKLMVAGYAVNALFTFSYLFVSSPSHLFLVQIGLGIGLALATPTWESLYAKYEDRKHGGYIWGLASGEAQLVTAIGIIMGGIIVSFLSFKTLFILMGIIQVIATLYQAQILRRGRS